VVVVVPALALVSLLLALVVPRSSPGLLAGLALPIIALAVAAGRLARSPRLGPIEWAALALIAYAALNASWAEEPAQAYGKVALLALYAVVVSLTMTAIGAIDGTSAQRLGRALVAAVVAGTVILALEVAFGLPLKRLVANLLPALAPTGKHARIEDGEVTEILLYVLNRNIGVLMLVLWPTLLLAWATLSRRLATVASAVLLLAAAVAVLGSEHETSKIGLVASAALLAVMHLSRRLGRVLVLAGWLAATLLIVPLADAAYTAKLYRAEWLPGTARNRVVLWGVTAERLRKAPILGIGIESTKAQDEDEAATAAWPKDHSYPLRTGRHSHNIYLQAWYELGAVGALILMALGVAVLAAMARMATAAQPYAYASFVAAAIIGAFSWGLWQPWFMAAYAIWGVLLLVAIDAHRRSESPRA
jgi:O-antigen ligase